MFYLAYLLCGCLVTLPSGCHMPDLFEASVIASTYIHGLAYASFRYAERYHALWSSDPVVRFWQSKSDLGSHPAKLLGFFTQSQQAPFGHTSALVHMNHGPLHPVLFLGMGSIVLKILTTLTLCTAAPLCWRCQGIWHREVRALRVIVGAAAQRFMRARKAQSPKILCCYFLQP